MTTFYSQEVTKINQTVPPTVLSPLDHHGRLRVARFTYDQGSSAGSAGDIIQLAKLPAGRVMLLGKLCVLYHNMTTGSNTIDVGWAAYTDLDGDAVAADGDGLDDGIDVETAGTINLGTVAAIAAVGSIKTFESQEGVIITLTSVGIPAANDVVKGFLTYVLD